MISQHMKLRRRLGTFFAASLLAAVVAVNPTPAAGFSDVPSGSYYATAVDWMSGNGITTGTSSTTFSPDDRVTRSQFATFLWRLAGEPAGSSAGFSDVPSSAYYAQAVSWMASTGITTGTSATTFSPNATLTRAQAATFIWRFAGSPSVSGGADFVDVSDSSFAADAIEWKSATGITTGTSPTTFSPDDPLTRGQAATFLYRYAIEYGSGKLSWAPPSGWQSYKKVYVDDDGGSINLDWNEDVLLVMPNEPVTGTVFVDGGRDVVVIGGTISINSTGRYDSDAMGMRFRDQTGVIHVEGVYMTGEHLTEGIQFNSPDAEAVVQNVRVDTLVGSQDENHADVIQPWGSLESLRIDRLTGASRYQGLMLKSDKNGRLGPVTVKNTDLTMVEGNPDDWAYPNNGGRYALWVSDGGSSTVYYEPGTVWIDTNSEHNSGDLHANVWPHPETRGWDSSVGARYVEWSDEDQISGRVHQGIPPQGDYVPVGVAGYGYQSPGYIGG